MAILSFVKTSSKPGSRCQCRDRRTSSPALCQRLRPTWSHPVPSFQGASYPPPRSPKTLISTLSQGANIDSADKHGISPLLAAIWEGHTSCVKFLVEKVFCQVPRWKGFLSSSSLKRFFVKFLVEKTLCLAPFWVKLLATSICPAVQLYNN